ARKIALNLIKDYAHNSIIVYNHSAEAIIALQPLLNELKTVLFSKYDGIDDRNNFNKAYFILDKDIIAPKNDRTSVPMTNITNCQAKSIPLSDLLKYKIGYQKDAKITFMNNISSEVAKIIENRLIKLEYQKNSEVIQRASIHLIDNKAQKRFIFSTNITSDGKLIPLLTTEQSTTKLPTELENLIKNATYNLDTKNVTLNDTSNYLFTVTRTKIKNTFIKCKNEFSNGKINLSISEVYEDGQKDVQVTVISEALQKVIEKMSQANNIEEELKLECDKEIEKLVNEVKTI
ncbi:43017_t:CDS:2, partial [Gigaspora margarita]